MFQKNAERAFRPANGLLISLEPEKAEIGKSRGAKIDQQKLKNTKIFL